MWRRKTLLSEVAEEESWRNRRRTSLKLQLIQRKGGQRCLCNFALKFKGKLDFNVPLQLPRAFGVSSFENWLTLDKFPLRGILKRRELSWIVFPEKTFWASFSFFPQTITRIFSKASTCLLEWPFWRFNILGSQKKAREKAKQLLSKEFFVCRYLHFDHLFFKNALNPKDLFAFYLPTPRAKNRRFLALIFRFSYHEAKCLLSCFIYR